jgi:hypothetical protein
MKKEIIILSVFGVLCLAGLIVIQVLRYESTVQAKKSVFKGDEIDSTCSLYLPDNGDARVRKIYLLNQIK